MREMTMVFWGSIMFEIGEGMVAVEKNGSTAQEF